MVVASGWVCGDSDRTKLVTQHIWPGHDDSLQPIQDTAVDMSSPPINGDQTAFNQPKATLICRPNSHPFQERNLILTQAVKIGRSVARDRVMVTNAIFECKVLSRNHALLWYENGKFYLQDTKSSNGTFVNNQRLSLGGMESQPHELCSGDVVQFGVDVIENTRKVTHGCIVATLKLYLPDGKEAKASQVSCVNSQGVGAVSAMELYQLNQYIQEATQREQQLEGKLGHLQRIVESTKSSAQQAWHCLLQEDLLLTRIDVLESQLQVFSTNQGEDKLRNEMVKLLNEKLKYQEVAKESLRHAIEEKLSVVQRNATLEAALCSAEEERDNTQRALSRAQEELQDVAARLIAAQTEIRELSTQCEHLEQLELQHSVLNIQIIECRNNEMICQAKYLCSQAKLAMLEMFGTKAGTPNNLKSETDVLDNENYHTKLDEDLVLRIDLQIDQLQRRLMELTTIKEESMTSYDNMNSATAESSEESNDNCSDITVIENDIGGNNDEDANNRNNTTALNENAHNAGSVLGLYKANINIMGNFEDSNTSLTAQQNRTIEQISNALLDLRTQREILVHSRQDNHEQPSYKLDLIEVTMNSSDTNIMNEQQQQNQNMELQAENERLQKLVESNRAQLMFYEQELVELNQKIETLGIELQTRPSHNSLQEKETICISQKITIENLLSEQDELQTKIQKSKQTEKDLQSKVNEMSKNVEELENTIMELQTSIDIKEKCIDHLKEEIRQYTMVEKISNEDSFAQTEQPPEKIGSECTTQTPKQEYADFENSIQKDFEFLTDPSIELQEELVQLKEQFALSLEQNSTLMSDIEKLQLDYNNALRQSRTMIFVYIAPLLALMCYLLLSPYMNPTVT